jgi:membrane protein
MQQIKNQITRWLRILRVVYLRKIIHLTRKIWLPGFQGVSLYEILFFFVWSIRKGLISTRAAAISFHFFLALIPFALVLVISSAYVPFFDLEKDIIPILSGFVPKVIIDNFIASLDELKNSTVNSILSVGFIMALYFISNGFLVIIQMFNASRINFDKRSWWSARLISILLVIGFVFVTLVMFLFMVWERKLLNYLVEQSLFVADHQDFIFYVFTFLIIGLIIYFSVAFLFYIAPLKRTTFKFMSAGATLTTVLVILIFLGYSFYVTNFANYNALYGSVGTIMVIMLWIYFNAYALLLGFELNASIHGAIQNKKLNSYSDLEKQYLTKN